jgi:hypothetical protein
MKIKHIRYGNVNLTLDTEDCRRLAHACALAADEIDTPEGDHIQTLGAFFQALAIAGYGQVNMTPDNHALLLADLQETGLTQKGDHPHVQ